MYDITRSKCYPTCAYPGLTSHSSTFYGTRANGDPNKIANLTATFAANAIAALDRFPPTGKKITTEGKRLSSGVAVKIMHRYLHMIYAGILGLQGLLGIAAALWSNTVVVKDDSYLSTARLLRRTSSPHSLF